MAKLGEAEIRSRLDGVPVVRLATVGPSGLPHLVVTTFALAGNQIFMAVDHKPKATRDLKRLRNIRINPQVAVLADHYEDDWERLWWARADGHARVIEDDPAMAHPIDLLVERYAQYERLRPAGPVIAITVTHWTGWAYTTPGRSNT
jgi:PPOX class probable F420-dependent enzyme